MGSLNSRLSTLMMTLGITLVFVALLGSGSFGFGTDVDSGIYKGYLFRATDDIYVEAWSITNQSFSLYALDSENALRALENASLHNTNQLVSLENITQCNDIIEIPSPGVYAILVTSYDNDTSSVMVDIDRSYPNAGVLVPGILLLSVGACIAILPRALNRIEGIESNGLAVNEQLHPDALMGGSSNKRRNAL